MRSRGPVIASKKLDILVVDDESQIGELLLEVLSQEGYRTAWYANAYDGLRQLARKNPRLVLADVMLPCMDGVELVKRAGEAGTCPMPRFVLMSAAPRPPGAPRDVPFLRKPFDLDSALGVIRAELAKAS